MQLSDLLRPVLLDGPAGYGAFSQSCGETGERHLRRILRREALLTETNGNREKASRGRNKPIWGSLGSSMKCKRRPLNLGTSEEGVVAEDRRNRGRCSRERRKGCTVKRTDDCFQTSKTHHTAPKCIPIESA